jgi:hypothetical protein
MYWTEILWLISWPVLIWVSYKLSVWAVKKFEQK